MTDGGNKFGNAYKTVEKMCAGMKEKYKCSGCRVCSGDFCNGAASAGTALAFVLAVGMAVVGCLFGSNCGGAILSSCLGI